MPSPLPRSCNHSDSINAALAPQPFAPQPAASHPGWPGRLRAILSAPPQAEFPRSFSPRAALPAAGAALLAFVLIPWAAPVHRVIYHFLNWLPFTEYFSTTNQFASATCVISLLLGIWLLDRPRRRAVIVLLAAFAFSSLANECIKQLAGRGRPAYTVRLDSSGRRELEKYIAAHPGTPIRAENKDHWLLLKKGRPVFNDSFSSFPSGHSNTAFLLAAFLLAFYPRARVIWWILAVGCALARVRFRRHFPEDILFGSALGWFMAQWAFTWRWPLALASKILTDDTETIESSGKAIHTANSE